jgi:uncharacterized phage-associated protein
MTMRLPFNEAKLTEAAALFLELGNRRMNYMKLIKLLYLADREALLRWGRPITTDCYVSMDRGPVLSKALDLITEGNEPGVTGPWYEHISPPSNYEVSLVMDCARDELSPAEEDLIREIYNQLGHMDQWQLVHYVHDNCGEWQDPDGSAIPIDYSDILRAGDKSESEISSIREELRCLAGVRDLLCSK